MIGSCALKALFINAGPRVRRIRACVFGSIAFMSDLGLGSLHQRLSLKKGGRPNRGCSMSIHASGCANVTSPGAIRRTGPYVWWSCSTL
jgi:hypothetical protein